eukprot:14519424-Alexandrium_andersonii.AAC.1
MARITSASDMDLPAPRNDKSRRYTHHFELLRAAASRLLRTHAGLQVRSQSHLGRVGSLAPM